MWLTYLAARIWTARSSLTRAGLSGVMTGRGLDGRAGLGERALAGGGGVLSKRTIATVSATTPRGDQENPPVLEEEPDRAESEEDAEGATPDGAGARAT